MRKLILILVMTACAACSSTTTVTKHIGPDAPRGTYILALTSDAEVRRMFEDRLAADMAERGLTAFTSYPDLPDPRNTSRDQVLAAARARNALFVLAVEEVIPGTERVVKDAGRITPEHPTLRQFLENNQPTGVDHDPKSTVFVEVSAFQIREDQAVLVWSGTTWSFQADGKGGAIDDISTTIADAINTERQRYLERYGRGPGED